MYSEHIVPTLYALFLCNEGYYSQVGGRSDAFPVGGPHKHIILEWPFRIIHLGYYECSENLIAKGR